MSEQDAKIAAVRKVMEDIQREFGTVEAFMGIAEGIQVSDELQKPERLMKLQHPLRADRDRMEVYYIDNIGSETENEKEIEIKEVDDDVYLEALNDEVVEKELLKEIEATGGSSSRKIIDETKLEALIKEVTKGSCPHNRAVRAAQVANIPQPDIKAFKDAGEMFLQQVVYNPIVELFCAFSSSYCADKKVTCAHALYCYENNSKKVQYSATCLPDAALRLVTEFYLIAMMELKSDGTSYGYQRDFYRCKLMTSMSVLAIAEYLIKKRKNTNDNNIDIAVPFILGNYESVELYVMRKQGAESPKIHCISTVFWDPWDPSNDSGKLDLLAKLAVILARIVKISLEHRDMARYFRKNYNDDANALKRNAIPDPSSRKKSTSKRSGSRTEENLGANRANFPSQNENAAKRAASRLGLIQGLEYPFPRIRELVMFDDDKIHSQREADFNFFQQESPFLFKGIDMSSQSSTETGNAVFCKVWREGDRHTSRKNVEEEIYFYKRANANDVPSPRVIDSLTALDVKCTALLDTSSVSIYHVLVTLYHQNDDVDEKDLIVFALSFILAVQKLHSIGILHCDIKPSNMIWDATLKKVLLIDFEHAQEEKSAQWYTTTRKYEAPEIKLGNPHTRKSDAYSVGKTLESVTKEFHSPVAQRITDVISSLLIESHAERISLVEAARKLQELNLPKPPCDEVATKTNRNDFSSKRGRDELGELITEV